MAYILSHHRLPPSPPILNYFSIWSHWTRVGKRYIVALASCSTMWWSSVGSLLLLYTHSPPQLLLSLPRWNYRVHAKNPKVYSILDVSPQILAHRTNPGDNFLCFCFCKCPAQSPPLSLPPKARSFLPFPLQWCFLGMANGLQVHQSTSTPNL